MPGEYRIDRWREIYSPNSAMLRLMLARDGYDVFQWSDRPGSMYGLHKHSEDQSHWIVSGQLEITVENVGTFLLDPGDRDFMPAETYHSARVIGDESVIYLIGIKSSPAVSEPEPEKPKRKRKTATRNPTTSSRPRKKSTSKT